MAKAEAASRAAPAPKPKIIKEELIRFYREMLLIRRFEEKAGQLYGMGLIGGFCHLYIGQEAVVVGMQSAIGEGDQVITAYRDHGHMLACGMDPAGVMAELTGRSGGYSRGKGGSMHMFSREKNFFGGHGIVGAQVPLGTGLAFANKYRGNDRVCLTYFGDGAANQGQVYESFNMAELWKLPVVYVIENNQYAMGTSVSRSSAETHLHKRGSSFNIPGEEVDGMDVMAVKAAGEKAVKWCREGKGPFILEMKTYRYRGHSMSDPAKYRTREEVDQVREKHDPIDHVRQVLLDAKMTSEDELKEIDKELRAVVSHAAEFAQTSPEPDVAELWTDIVHWMPKGTSGGHEMRATGFAIVLASLMALPGANAAPPVAVPPIIVAKAPNLVPIASRMTKGTISVRNTGSAAAGPFKVTVECKNLGGGGCVEPPARAVAPYEDPAFPNKLTVTVPGLAVGHVFNHKIAFWDGLVWPAGNYEFTVVADAGAAVAETNEGDNSGGTVLNVP